MALFRPRSERLGHRPEPVNHIQPPIVKPCLCSSRRVGTEERKLMNESCSVGIMDVRLGKTSLASSREMTASVSRHSARVSSEYAVHLFAGLKL